MSGNTRNLLAILGRDIPARFVEKTESRLYNKGDYVVRHREDDNSVYIIEYGSVRVTTFSPEGKEISYTELGSGDNFGELSAIDGRARSASVIALEQSRLSVIPPAVFMELLHHEPAIAVELLRQMTAVVRRLCDRIFEYSTLDLSTRLVLELVRLYEAGTPGGTRPTIRNPPTHLQLASRLGCSREAISRELANLEQAGLVRRGRRMIELPDYSRLRSRIGNYPV